MLVSPKLYQQKSKLANVVSLWRHSKFISFIKDQHRTNNEKIVKKDLPIQNTNFPSQVTSKLSPTHPTSSPITSPSKQYSVTDIVEDEGDDSDDGGVVEVTPIVPHRFSTSKGKEWQYSGLKPGRKAPTEGLLLKALSELFPNEEISGVSKSYFPIRHPNTGKKLEIDATIKSKNLAFEYQDPYHFTAAVKNICRPLKEIQLLDEHKRRYFEGQSEFTFFQIPSWWDGTADSLKATIHRKKPNLWPGYVPTCPPISETPPDDFFEDTIVPHIGIPMRAVFFTKRLFHACSDWLWGEKLDGIRFSWDPIQQKLYSSYGNELRFLEEFKNQMPNECIEGEVWFEQDSYNQAIKLKSTSTAPVKWDLLRLRAFDIPPARTVLDSTPYINRYTRLCEVVPKDHPFLSVISMTPLTGGLEQLEAELQQVLTKGGEGIILRSSGSPYEQGYSYNYLKVKEAKDDEARVLSISTRFITLELTDETKFKSDPTFIPKKESIQEGDIITISYKRRINGTTIPYKPKFIRLRKDIEWDDIVASGAQIRLGYRGRDYTDRYDKNIGCARDLFIDYARSRGFDPMIADHWYSKRTKDILVMKDARRILRPYNGSFIAALKEAFPDIVFDASKFRKLKNNYWSDTSNVTRFFDDIARELSFHPRDEAYKWYSVGRDQIIALKRYGPLRRFGGSHIKALMAAYPDVGLDPSKFSYLPRNFWADTANTTSFFNSIARELGFHPRDEAYKWYSVTWEQIIALKGRGPRGQFGGSHIKALMAAYPDVGLDPSKFYHSGNNNAP